VYGVVKIILLDQDLFGDGGKNNEFLFLINKKRDGVAT
jgi:hypothetical protein